MTRLRNKIFQPRSQTKQKSSTTSSGLCILKSHSKCNHCTQKGYRILAPHAFVEAQLCSCVQTCPVCGGLAPVTERQACAEPRLHKIIRCYQAAQIPARYINAQLENFQNFSGNGREIVNKIRLWLQGYLKGDRCGLILSGPVGCGKTYLMAAIAHALCQKGYSVRYVDFHRLLALIRAAYAQHQSEEAILSPLIEADVLIIDELGKGRNNDWEQEQLDQLVMGRYGQNNKIIVASTNYSLSTSETTMNRFYSMDLSTNNREKAFDPDVFGSLAERVGQRIFSRLEETSIFLEMNAKNFRPHLKPQLTQGHKPHDGA